MTNGIDLLLMGIDGLDGRLMNEWLGTDRLPAMSRDHNAGQFTHKRIDSWKTDDINWPFTPQAWAALYQGGPAPLHGIEIRNGNKHYHVDRDHFNFTTDVGPTVFDDLSHAEYTLNCFRMPMTFPARPVNGWLVSGCPAGKGGTNFDDRELWNMDTERLPVNYPHVRSGTVKVSGHDTVNDHIKTEEDRYQIFKYLTASTDADVLCYGSQLPDMVGHVHTGKVRDDECETVFDNSEAARRTYEKIDSVYGRLVDRFDPEYVVGISDHGFSTAGYKNAPNVNRSYHSFDSSFFVYARDGNLPDLTHVTQILDYRKFVCNLLNITYGTSPYGTSHIEEYTEEDKEELRDHLEAMGYIE